MMMRTVIVTVLVRYAEFSARPLYCNRPECDARKWEKLESRYRFSHLTHDVRRV